MPLEKYKEFQPWNLTLLNNSSTVFTACSLAVRKEERVVKVGASILRDLAASNKKEVGWGSGGGMFLRAKLKEEIKKCIEQKAVRDKLRILS